MLLWVLIFKDKTPGRLSCNFTGFKPFFLFRKEPWYRDLHTKAQFY